MDEGQRSRGRELHSRIAEGETLSAEEQTELETYYVAVEGMSSTPSDVRLASLEERNRNLEALVARSEAFAAYLQTVLTTADAERQALEREFQRIAA